MSSAAPAPRQLVLALDHGESFAREDFLAGPTNETALALIERWPDWPSSVMALVGPEASGKSHLASIWAEISGARILSASLLSGADVPMALATGALVVEDLAAQDLDERALFHLLNLAREESAFVLVTGRASPASFAVTIPDLGSRLRALPIVSLAAPDEALLRALLVKLAADRQLVLDDALISFLINRIERSVAAAREAVARLDREAMRLRRPVTRALAAEIFRETAV